MKENVENKIVNLLHVSTEEMIADALTKSVTGMKVKLCNEDMDLGANID